MNGSVHSAAPAQASPVRSRWFRWQAFAVHVGISLVILAALLYVLCFHWFPGFLFDTDGGWQALRIIIAVDLVLGPLLTLIAASAAKPRAELRRDLSMIALVQVAALAWGVWLSHENRPIAVVYLDGWFYVQARSAYNGDPEALAVLDALPGAYPKPVYLDIPADLEARGRLYAGGAGRKTSVIYASGLYRPLHEHVGDIAAGQRRILAAPLQTAGARQQTAAFLAGHGLGDASLVLWVAAKSRYRNHYLAVDVRDGGILGSLDVEPPYKP